MSDEIIFREEEFEAAARAGGRKARVVEMQRVPSMRSTVVQDLVPFMVTNSAKVETVVKDMGRNACSWELPNQRTSQQSAHELYCTFSRKLTYLIPREVIESFVLTRQPPSIRPTFATVLEPVAHVCELQKDTSYKLLHYSRRQSLL